MRDFVSNFVFLNSVMAAVSGGLPQTVSCSFDAGLCNFLQDRQDDIDWTLNSGKTLTVSTGPDCDPVHCDTGGQYLYIESSRPSITGQKAKLRTPTLGGEGLRCLSFYYHMYGNHIRSLTVMMTNIHSGSQHILWAASGNQGRQWKLENVNFQAVEAYEISFEATVGVHNGDIAIDSVSVTVGTCTASMRFNCSFEHDLCGWTNVGSPADSLDWSRRTGETDTPNTGPTSDRASDDGYYLYVESSRTRPGDMARLVSPEVRATHVGGHCLTFWYHLYGRTTGNLTVFYQTENGQDDELWSVGYDQGNVWYMQQVNITHRATYPFKVVFEATVSGFLGDVAIDDITLQNAFCRS